MNEIIEYQVKKIQTEQLTYKIQEDGHTFAYKHYKWRPIGRQTQRTPKSGIQTMNKQKMMKTGLELGREYETI